MKERRDAISIPQDGPSTPEFPMLSPDGLTLLTDFAAGTGRRARLWDTATGEPRCGPIELPQAVDNRAASTADAVRRYFHAAWTADGKRLYLPDSGKTIRVVDVASGKVIRTFTADVETKVQISFAYTWRFSPDEKWCAQSCPGGTIQVRNTQTGALLRTVGGLDSVQRALVFSPDGLAAARAPDRAGTLKIWDIATGREIAATKLTGVVVIIAQFSAGRETPRRRGHPPSPCSPVRCGSWTPRPPARSGRSRDTHSWCAIWYSARTDSVWQPPAPTTRSDSGT